MAMTFREYLWQQVKRIKCPQASIPHIGWSGKAIGADVGIACLVVSGVAGAFYPPSGIIANKLFMLLWVGCPFLWLYDNYCFQRAGEEEGRNYEPKK